MLTAAVTKEKKSEAQITRSLLQQALEPVTGDLQTLDGHLVSLLPMTSATAREIAKHVFSAGGKRIRPALFFFSCRLTGYEGDHYYPIGSVCEYVHTASLLHDDVVDNSTMRRNKPTANSIWGDQAGVLVGDLIYARASELMAATGSLELVRTFSEAIRMMSEGEVFQLEQIFNPDITEEDYFRILRCKTAYLIAACSKAAGFLANSSAIECEALGRYGLAIGMAFQLIDDALDYDGNLAEMGKNNLSDLLEGKVTMPIIALRDRMTQDEKNWFKSAILNDDVDQEIINRVADMVQKYKTVETTIARARAFTEEAVEALQVFPPSAAREHLELIAKNLLSRVS